MSIEKIGVESKEELKQMISNEVGQIEKGLTVVCSDVPIDDKARLDVLCHDNKGQIVVLQLNVEEDDNMLLQGIRNLDYVDKFKSFLKVTYSKHKIDDKEKPRLVLVAPNFSETLRHAVEHMQGIHVDLYEWEYLKIGDHKGLRLQPIFTWKPPEKPKESKTTETTEKKQETKPEKKKEKTPTKEEEPEPEKEQFPEFLPRVEPKEEKKEEEEPESKKKVEPPKRKIRLF